MSDKSKIEWYDASWQPVVGCSHVSEGCRNCFAEKMAVRLQRFNKYREVIDYPKARDGAVICSQRWNGKTYCDNSALEIPLHWKKPRRIFVCSMGDLFHESVPFEFINKVSLVMARCPQHTFQVLTKRPEIALEHTKNWQKESGYPSLFSNNVWLGVTAENQKCADERIPILLQIPAKIRFLSIEPLLSKINLTKWLGVNYTNDYAESEKRKPNISPDNNGRVCDRLSGKDLAERKKSRTQTASGLSSNKKNDKTETLSCISSQVGISTFQRRNTKRVDNKPQERDKGRQPSREPRNSDLCTTNETYAGDIGKEPEDLQSRRRGQHNGGSDGKGGEKNTASPHTGGTIEGDSERLSGNISDNLANLSQRHLEQINQVIIGCESLPGGRAGRFQDGFINAVIEIVGQCKAASVPVFVKQVPINGKVNKNMAEWPEELQIHEYPAKKAKHKEILYVSICEAKPNKLFTEEQRQSIRFLIYNKRVKCAECGKKAKKMWTMLCQFKAANLGSIHVEESEKSHLPLTPVCDKHPLGPDFEE